ncbi:MULTISPECIES: hypothetical protein [Bacillus]|uniref:hypothetical protein n=1 Tax=Bacillus TaxID=1386 RepID=UPI0003E23EC8|nr:hypothetical protein [Bacillus cereus]ETT73186.1 hypothetical protein C175_26363 [Bacillus cereus]KZD79468.1 hypothetical protein B4155_3435 [Bacillus cereus]OOR38373.1 hypothetical protein BW895_22290 [Bacillus cereus]
MTQTKLRRLKNNVEVIGTLKSKELEVRRSEAGANYITGKLIVQSNINNLINEQVIEVFVMASSKLYSGVETVMNEYKTIEADGVVNADRVRVRGILKLNEFKNNQGILVQYNQVRGMMFNRLDKTSDVQDKANASIETVVEGFEAVVKDGLATGEYLVKGFTVGWNDEVIEFKDVIVGQEVAQDFMNLYPQNSTGRLVFQLSSYVEEEKQASSPGFGTTLDMKETFETTKKYTRSIRVIGGDVPFFGTNEYTTEEIYQAKQLRAQKLSDMKAKEEGSIIKAGNGFGQGLISNQTPAVMSSSNEIPDFL